MICSRRQVVWFVAACAALVAQVAPQAFCRSCDRPCCEIAVESAAESATGCPLCAAATDACAVETSEQPCRCQLDARQDRPISPSKGVAPAFDPVDQDFLPTAAPAAVPQTLGVSREYVAASMSVPIRPPRILFGVWRN